MDWKEAILLRKANQRSIHNYLLVALGVFQSLKNNLPLFVVLLRCIQPLITSYSERPSFWMMCPSEVPAHTYVYINGAH